MNLPNKLSLLRIILVPVMVFFYLATFVPYGKAIALGIFIISALTDLFDGRIARKNGLVTNLGKMLDPIADKILALSVLLLLIADETIPAPFGVIAGIIILGRDFMVDMLRQIGASKNQVIAADKWGKLKTVVFDIAFPLLLLVAFLEQDLLLEGGAVYVINIIALGLFTIGTVLCVISGINYMINNSSVFKDNPIKNEKNTSTQEDESKEKIETDQSDTDAKQIDSTDND